MPAVASSSRRKVATRRRQASEDIEDAPTQSTAPRDDVDEGEDEQPAPRERKPKKAKVEKKPGASARRAAVVDAGDGDDEDGTIDVANFQDQPLGKADLTKLRGLAADWGNIRQSVQGNSTGLVRDVAVSIADHAEGEAAAKGLTQLEIIMKELIDLEEEMVNHEKTVDEIYQAIAQGELIDDAVERYHAGVTEKVQAYTKKTSRQKYAKNERFALFKQGIHEVQNPDEAMPPITEFIPKEPGDDSDDDDEVEIGGVTQDYKCPITLTPLEDPYTSTVCKHSFSGAAIREFFANNRTVLKSCPAAGCNKKFKLGDCEPDKELARRARAAQRRAQRHDSDSDAEEVIE